jgi:serine/threonine-protein kinase
MGALAVDRHLLFGLLALQNGLIQQAQLVAAFHAWTCDKSRILADHLVRLGHLNAAQRAAVEALAAVHIDAHGGVEQSLAAVHAGKSARAGLAGLGDPDIGATLDRVGSGGGVTEHDDPDDPDRTSDYSVGAATSDGQRFRILRPHARGGLGAVSVAFDGELRREVALKQILEEHADDPASRRRFLAEAEITGGLEHPGIVPVYGLGADGRGRPYYAMRLIGGESLKAAIARFRGDEALKSEPGRRSLELRRLLRRFIDVCNAVEYAHSRGVIHRDLKPANIIVGRHGETLVVDWGLAKSVGRADPSAGERTIVPSSSGSSETLPGSALGTPGYMSPEQARGELDQLGPRSDVYGLGATLYCLLTGRPPFEGKDGGAVLCAVREGDFARPTRLDPSIDPALEAVCLRAMALQPEARYGSPRSLAEDVERWMADEPVSAWAEPWTRRLSRWLTWHRTGVSGAAATVLAGVVGLSAVLAVQASANARLSESLQRETGANTALAAANTELERSKAAVQVRYDLALEAIKTFHTGVSEDFLLKEAKFKELRDRLLKSASDFYGKLGARLGRETDLASRRALAQSNFELAELTGLVGRGDAALAAHRAVLAMREALAAEAGADIGTNVDVGQSLTAVALLLGKTGQMREALAVYRRSELLLAGLMGSDRAARAALAACRRHMARRLVIDGQPAEALAACKLARADQEALAEAPGASNDACRDLADTVEELGFVLSGMGRLSEAEAEHRAALALYQKLVADNPTVADFRNRLANSHVLHGFALSTQGKLSEALAEHRTAGAIYQKLVGDNPAVSKFRYNVAVTHIQIGVLQFATAHGQPSKAEAELRMAIAILQKLAEENRLDTDIPMSVARFELGSVLSATGRPSEAEAEQRAALAVYQKLADDNPAVAQFRESAANSRFVLADLLTMTGRPAEAEAECRTALASFQKLAEENPAVPYYRSYLGTSQGKLGLLLLQKGRPADAEAESRTALAILERLVGENPTHPFFPRCVADTLDILGDVVRLLGRPSEAEGLYDREIAVREPLFRENPTDLDQRYRLVRAIRRRGLARRDLNDFAGAAADTRRALSLCDGLRPLSGRDLFETACCHAALAGPAGRAALGVSADEAEIEAARAMESLVRAVAAGYRNANEIRIESALEPLRSRDDFRILILELAFPAEPFARAE